MQTLVEDFSPSLRHARGQSDNTAKTYAALLGKFTVKSADKPVKTEARNSSLFGWPDAAISFFGFAGVFILPMLAQCRRCPRQPFLIVRPFQNS